MNRPDPLQLKHFASRLVELRVAKGFTQSSLARELFGNTISIRGVKIARNRHYISAWEDRRGFPSRFSLQNLAQILDTTIEDLAPWLGKEDIL